MNRPWMPLYIADYLRDTSHLGALESGAYLHLIMSYWVKGALPDDDRQLAAIARMTMSEWRRARPILAAFFGPHWASHKRIDAELHKASVVSSKRRASAHQRWNKEDAHTDAHADANAGVHADANASTPHTLHVTDDGGGDARAAVWTEAASLAERLHAVMGWERDAPQAIGNVHLAQKWLAAGWHADLCVTTVQRVRAASRKPIATLAYFEKPIAQAHADLRRPVPVAVVSSNPEVVHVAERSASNQGGAARSGITSAIDACIDRLAGAEPEPGGREGGTGGREGGKGPAGLLSLRRGQ
jgi:uncharacterized protein YdaU (DUF1376 family)